MKPFPIRISPYKDRHGKTRYRYRRRGISVEIKEAPGTPEFVARCEELAKTDSDQLLRSRPRRGKRKKGVADCSLPRHPGDPRLERTLRSASERSKTSHNSILRVGARRRAIEDYCVKGLGRMKNRAVKGGVPFDLTPDDLRRILAMQRWKCAISGIDFDLRRPFQRGPVRAFGPSVDRIEPKSGYRAGNIRVVCNIVNFAMNQWGLEPLIHLVTHMRFDGTLREQTENFTKFSHKFFNEIKVSANPTGVASAQIVVQPGDMGMDAQRHCEER